MAIEQNLKAFYLQALECKVEQYLSDTEHEVLWTLPYCLDQHPIEFFWGCGKNTFNFFSNGKIKMKKKQNCIGRDCVAQVISILTLTLFFISLLIAINYRNAVWRGHRQYLLIYVMAQKDRQENLLLMRIMLRKKQISLLIHLLVNL